MKRAAWLVISAILVFAPSGCGTFSDMMCGPVDQDANGVYYRGVRLDLTAAEEGGWFMLMAADIPFFCRGRHLVAPLP